MGKEKSISFGLVVWFTCPFYLAVCSKLELDIFANVLLGINQGLAWSMTVNMKVDLVGRKNRGLALGLNEFAGYVSVAIVGFATGYLGSIFGLKPYPFYMGIAFAILGFLISWLVGIPQNLLLWK